MLSLIDDESWISEAISLNTGGLKLIPEVKLPGELLIGDGLTRVRYRSGLSSGPKFLNSTLTLFDMYIDFNLEVIESKSLS